MATSRLQLTFDIPMLEVPIAGGDMFFRINNTERALTFLNWGIGNLVRFNTAIVGANIGPDIVSFTGSPMTFQSAEGVPAETFTDFPVT